MLHGQGGDRVALCPGTGWIASSARWALGWRRGTVLCRLLLPYRSHSSGAFFLGNCFSSRISSSLESLSLISEGNGTLVLSIIHTQFG